MFQNGKRRIPMSCKDEHEASIPGQSVALTCLATYREVMGALYTLQADLFCRNNWEQMYLPPTPAVYPKTDRHQSRARRPAFRAKQARAFHWLM
jgi:hypothetical protein